MNELNPTPVQPESTDFASHSSSRRLTRSIGLLGIILLTFCGGYLYGVWSKARLTPQEAVQEIIRQADGQNLSDKVDFSLYWDVWNRIKRDYVRQPVSESDLFYGSISGLVAGTGDPYSVFFDPTQTTSFKQALEGSFGGVGLDLGVKNGQIVVISPLPNTPGSQAGIQAGDAILAVDDQRTDDKSIDEVVALIRGEVGTTVKLLLQRGSSDPFEKTLTREIIQPPSVTVEYKTEQEKTAAIIHVFQFTRDSSTQFHSILNEVILRSPDLVILDLRNNPGGFVDAGVDIASEWIASGPILYEQNQTGERTPTNSTGGGRLSDQKTVVLINGGSASASEIVAGALQDNEKAIVVGETSFGKGSVQDVHDFADGSSLKLTISLWLTPKFRTIDKTGITPDVVVPFTQADFDAGRDPQIDAAFTAAFLQ